jgi:hypothetical protein
MDPVKVRLMQQVYIGGQHDFQIYDAASQQNRLEKKSRISKVGPGFDPVILKPPRVPNSALAGFRKTWKSGNRQVVFPT